jgi:MFS family permease
VCATVGFGLITYIPADHEHCTTKWTFFGAAVFVRSVQGIADAFIVPACYSMVTIEFPENASKYVGYIEMALGTGMMLGPVIGTIYMNICNSIRITFYLFGV